MSYASVLQLASACVGVVGALFFAVGILRQTVEAMGRLSRTYWDWNPHLAPALAAQKAEYIFGGGLIFLSFLLQIGSFLASKEFLFPIRSARFVPWFACLLTLFFYGFCRWLSSKLARHYEAEILHWLKAQAEKEKTPASS